MVQAYDLGEYNDLHPFDKKGVGHRIALACDSLIYHNSVFFKGPCAVDFAWHRDFVEILFETDTPLTVCDGTDRVHGFQTVDETGRIRNVEAKLKSENEVRVEIDERVKVLMYAWNNYPGAGQSVFGFPYAGCSVLQEKEKNKSEVGERFRASYNRTDRKIFDEFFSEKKLRIFLYCMCYFSAYVDGWFYFYTAYSQPAGRSSSMIWKILQALCNIM